ncbi:MAG: aminoglycoside 6-adenylyltransferase [Caldicoprobacterales bacterium]|nr:aminoglycoside 6-adenylyltransferase [Clostridiales bacterium]
MRSEAQMMDLILSFAKNDPRVRVVGMEGSRTNVNVPKDEFQDYDITYVVTDMESFKKDDKWLDYFGKRIIMQKPEAMSLFPPELGNWFSYLMLFEDGNRIDLTLVPIDELEQYISSDKLLMILLDKDKRIQEPIIPTDEDYHVKKPSPEFFDDCCNEFWWVSTYVSKGLFRKEILFAIEHLNMYVRPNLLRMMAWKVGIETDFSISVGKSYKYMDKYLSQDVWKRLLSTYRNSSYEEIWDALFECHSLFRETSKFVANKLGYRYPDYDDKVIRYIRKLYQSKAEKRPGS